MTQIIKEEALHASGDKKLSIVAVTACATGVAHTYMAAEQLERLAKDNNLAIKIETQGVLGIKNKVTAADVNLADLAIIASDITIDEPSRFDGCRIINVRISSLLLRPSELIVSIKKIIHQPRGKVIDL
ncbi:fructose-specific PTS system IIB-like component [Gibbsiella quercinecans]|uniref:protein-N(pi)-phosphohistidine--D-fructose phosphotransferase n=1 Tax=Gibbsiella quercinecans TaxID=929813 RepID=A0A250B1R3_9GAMM|nr:fructose PTS transporter subunit IIB [Gibbsiella quercinecans]ATA20104.1 PTS glucitol transporter subunit IIA [Gibbsiella quercinecans]RLM08052.1 PTS glucitol transporter subunit IIA [Gibbsiella quercinecans]RLM09042.1 PTS glucitol transporter subunit IIA [Gibbsiella quercinecans]RLM10911.1 PTS glucitol transporter subunit IIA [Gibbsiella quercinecans]TCT86487.1 fructose-specific PTS system IIB-like component [Gibbsiella quercinecans]